MALVRVYKGEMLSLFLSFSQAVTICSAEASVELITAHQSTHGYSPAPPHTGTAVAQNDETVTITAGVVSTCHLCRVGFCCFCDAVLLLFPFS